MRSSILIPLGLSAAVLVGLALIRKAPAATIQGGRPGPAASNEREQLVQRAYELNAARVRNPSSVNMTEVRDLAARLRQVDEAGLARILETTPL